MKQLLVKNGKVVVTDVPSPKPGRHEILVETWYSAVSPGTEKSQLKRSGLKVLQTLVGDRNKRTQGLAFAKRKGLAAAWQRLSDVAFSERTLGYSLSGVVIGLGEEVTGLRIGDKVACAGSGKACHAERVVVPEKLAVSVPEGVSMPDAATVALGAIALQSVRRTDPALGETVAVIGLGILGKLTVQLLQAAGCRVAVFDIDPQRITEIEKSGVEYPACVNEKPLETILADISRITGGHGVDACVVTAGSSDSSPLDLACDIVRQKGRIVVVGDIPVAADRTILYKKELDLKLSCSCGPGRYDPTYEEMSVDYPFAHVRWTEQRNMACYVDLLKRNKINVAGIFDAVFGFDEAPRVYGQLLKGQLYSAVFRYPASEENGTDAMVSPDKEKDFPSAVKSAATGKEPISGTESQLREDKIVNYTDARRQASGIHLGPGLVRVALVGAGSYARSVLIPCLKKLDKLFRVVSICDTDGLRARRAAAVFKGSSTITDLKDVLENEAVDAVIIATRHDLHASQSIAALEAGKAVFVEKPAALSREELRQVMATVQASKLPYMVGFNRRYAPFSLQARKLLTGVPGAMMITYRVAAGCLPDGHWVKSSQGGGRIIGEVCHMVDLIAFLAGSPVEAVSCVVVPNADGSLDDNLQVLFTMKDGSTAALTYTAMGAEKTGKELIEILAGNMTVTIKDFEELHVLEGRTTKARKRIKQDKGHLMELKVFRDHMCGLSESGCRPMPLPEIERATDTTFSIAETLRTHR